MSHTPRGRSATRSRSTTPRRPTPIDTEPLLEQLAASIRVPRAELAAIPPKLLEEAIAELGVDIAHRIALVRAVAALTATRPDNMAAYLRQRDLERAFPWKVSENKARVQLDAFRAQFADPLCFEKLRATFVASARAKILTEMEAAVCHHLLYGESGDYGRYFLAALLLNVPPSERAGVHNWNVAAQMPEARREAHGAAIARLGCTLFPDTAELATLNARILSNVALEGGAAPAGDPGVYARRGEATLFGGGALPITTTAAGTFLETGPLEAALAHLGAQIAAVEGQVRNARRQGQQHQRQPQQHQQQRGRGRGVHRGRGRGRGGYYGGGGATEADDQDLATVMAGNGPAPPTH